MPARKTTGRKKTTGKNKMRIKGANGKVTVLTKTKCGSVAAIRKAAEAARKRGKKARVVKNAKGGGACLFVGGTRKKKRA